MAGCLEREREKKKEYVVRRAVTVGKKSKSVMGLGIGGGKE